MSWYRLLFDHLPDAVLLVDAAGRLLDLNPAATRLLGYDRADASQLAIGDLLGHDPTWASARVTRFPEDGVWRGASSLRSKDGALTPVDSWGMTIPGPGGPVYAAFYRDRSASGVLQTAARASEARFQRLLEQLPTVVYVMLDDRDYTPVYMSPGADALLGPGARVAYLANEWRDRIHPADREHVDAELQQSAANKSPYRVEYRFRRDDGAYVWLRDESRLYADDRGVDIAWQGILMDVTDQHDLQDELERARDAAEESNRLKSAFLSTMSHELRTPMTAIIGYASLLLGDANRPLDPEQRRDLEQIMTSADRLLGLINDVLDLSRIEAGGIELASEPIDLAAELESVRAELAPLAVSKGLGIATEPAPDLPEVCGDPLRVRQVLLNLVGNAVKFTDRGGVTVTARYVADTVEIAVRDTGIGIGPDVLPHVFEEFRQADESTTRRHGGSGLGLAIAKRLAELHGGTIDVESIPGEGSTFTLVLPVRPGPDAAVDRDD